MASLTALISFVLSTAVYCMLMIGRRVLVASKTRNTVNNKGDGQHFEA